MYAQAAASSSSVGEERDQRAILAPARRAAVRAQRLRVRPQQVPGAGRHDRGVPRLRGAGASASSSSATRSSASRRSIRSPARSSRSSTGSCCSRRRTTSPTTSACSAAIEGIEAELAERLAVARGARQAARGAAAAHAHHLRPRDAARGRRVLGHRELLAPPRRPQRRRRRPYTLLDYFPDDFLVRARRVARRRSRSCTASTRATGRARTRSSSTASGCRRRWTTGRCASRSSSRRSTRSCSCRPRRAPYELEVSTQVVEQIVRPTGLIDPEVIVQPTKGQIDDLVAEINARAERDQRVLVTTLTKKMAEDLTDYLLELGIRVRYLHSEVDTLERVEILRVAAARRVRRARRHQPAAGGPRPARGVARRDPRRRQGGLPPLGDVAHPDDRARRPQRRRSGDHVRRPDDRLDAPRDLARRTAGARSSSSTTPSTASTRRRSARRSPTSSRWSRLRDGDDAASGRVAAGAGAAGSSSARRCSTSPTCRPTSSAGSSRPSQDEMHEAAKDLRFEEAARLRDEINELKRELKAVADRRRTIARTPVRRGRLPDGGARASKTASSVRSRPKRQEAVRRRCDEAPASASAGSRLMPAGEPDIDLDPRRARAQPARTSTSSCRATS